MIPSNIEPKQWDSLNAGELLGFLNSNTGKLLFEWLAFYSPELLDGSDVNKTLVASGEVKGFNKAISTIFSLTKEQPTEAQSPRQETYPDLDDESKWQEASPDKPKPKTK